MLTAPAAPSFRLLALLRLPLWGLVLADLALGLAPQLGEALGQTVAAWLPRLGMASGLIAMALLARLAEPATLAALRRRPAWAALPRPAQISLMLLALIITAVLATVLSSPLTPLALGQALAAGQGVGLALLVSGFALQSAVVIGEMRAAAAAA
jgi:hypothetical protein